MIVFPGLNAMKYWGKSGRQLSKAVVASIGEFDPAMDVPTPPFGRRKLLFEGRIEKRSLAVVPVCLMTIKEPRFSERTVTRNVSPHGARVVTKRLWQPGEEPLLTPPGGEFPQPARVVYCQPRSKGGFYVGVQFSGRSVRWPDSSSM